MSVFFFQLQPGFPAVLILLVLKVASVHLVYTFKLKSVFLNGFFRLNVALMQCENFQTDF